MATKIICRASDCIFWEDKLCTSEEIVYDPEEGCLTYEVLDDDMVALGEEEWEEDELLEDEGVEEEDLGWDEEEEEEDDLFLDDDLEEEDDEWRL